MSITPSKQTSVYRQVDAILKTEDIYGGRQVPLMVVRERHVLSVGYTPFYTLAVSQSENVIFM